MKRLPKPFSPDGRTKTTLLYLKFIEYIKTTHLHYDVGLHACIINDPNAQKIFLQKNNFFQLNANKL